MGGKLDRVIGDIEVLLGVDLGNGERRVLLDALAILKGCVPRVMSLEEVVQAKDCWVWMERRGDGFAGRRYRVEPEYHIGRDDRGNHLFEGRASRPEDCYGIKWRCWNAEPGENERKIAAWNRRADDEQEA